jgi:hypothetical protein
MVKEPAMKRGGPVVGAESRKGRSCSATMGRAAKAAGSAARWATAQREQASADSEAGWLCRICATPTRRMRKTQRAATTLRRVVVWLSRVEVRARMKVVTDETVQRCLSFRTV